MSYLFDMSENKLYFKDPMFVYYCMYLSNPSTKSWMQHKVNFKRLKAGFLFSLTCCLTKAKALFMFDYLSFVVGRTWALERIETQTAS